MTERQRSNRTIAEPQWPYQPAKRRLAELVDELIALPWWAWLRKRDLMRRIEFVGNIVRYHEDR